MNSNLLRKAGLPALLITLLGGLSHIQATTIVAAFSNPVFVGTYSDTNGNPVSQDNTNTAHYFISNSLDPTIGGGGFQQTGSEILWGSNGGAPDEFSLLIFFGKTIPNDPTQTFDLGTLVYNNGTSALNTVLFGASVTFYATESTLTDTTCNPATFACGTSNIDFATTSNIGTSQSKAFDADYIRFSGVVNQTFNVYEGASATAELYGHFVDDPVITLDRIVLDPGQEDNGFIGNGQPAATPEPTSIALFGGGLLSLALVRFRASRKSKIH